MARTTSERAVNSATQLMVYVLAWAEWGWRGPAGYVAVSLFLGLVLNLLSWRRSMLAADKVDARAFKETVGNAWGKH